jgi:hypothetical protein
MMMGDVHYSPCSMNRVPKITSYAEAKAHYDSVKSWFHCGDKPIKGQLRYDNMRMRAYSNGAIGFRLYATQCVVYYPDETLTVQGYATMSTNAFVDTLTPDGIVHAMGRKGWDEPILHLRRDGEGWWLDHADGSYKRNEDVLIVNCSDPVKLRRDEDEHRWVPIDETDLQPFEFTEIDTKKARAANKQLRLQSFIDAAPMVDAFSPELREPDGEVDVAMKLKLDCHPPRVRLKIGDVVLVHKWVGEPRNGGKPFMWRWLGTVVKTIGARGARVIRFGADPREG